MLASARAKLAIALVAVTSAACSAPPEDTPRELSVYTRPAHVGALSSFVAYLPLSAAHLREAADPAAALRQVEPGTAAVAVDIGALTCRECYRLEAVEPLRYIVRAGDKLGAQYGLAALLEHAGLRFYHPFRSYVPTALSWPRGGPGFDTVVEPKMSVRGLHMHTLHPIEGYYAALEPSEQNLEQMRRIIDWVAKNRGNRLMWVLLDNITTNADNEKRYKDHTRAILAEAHARGIEINARLQLFGSGNLQHAFDLIEGDEPDLGAAIDGRLKIALDGLDYDAVGISFGEFFSEQPQRFVDTLDLLYERLQKLKPGIELAAQIHVGNQKDQRVQFKGEELQYYFLVKHANPAIVKSVHTVMYYTLFGDAGGAYQHDEFNEHREFLLERLRAGQHVRYFPETAYWVTFDNSVPAYLPLYIRSRWLDIDEIGKRTPSGLDDHVLFSSGWEWGYWQHDVAALRMSFAPPQSYLATLQQMFAPWLGGSGARVAQVIFELAELQQRALIDQRLAPYLAGRDSVLDLGRKLDPPIISQPDRPSLEEIKAYDQSKRDAFTRSVLEPLAALRDGIAALAARLRGFGLDTRQNPFAAELVDAFEITEARARFVTALFSAALALAAEKPIDTFSAAMDQALADGKAIVARRHGALFYPEPERLLPRRPNATFYPFGYLHQAHTLCYWVREHALLARLAGTGKPSVPNCAL
ncbi:MAG: hypothetical protein KC503_18395 [Myxococcales bacterium]|nr:hypothetical protein [Myxococcales bacterium]